MKKMHYGFRNKISIVKIEMSPLGIPGFEIFANGGKICFEGNVDKAMEYFLTSITGQLQEKVRHWIKESKIETLKTLRDDIMENCKCPLKNSTHKRPLQIVEFIDSLMESIKTEDKENEHQV